MTISIVVQRAPANYEGNQISNPLIVTVAQATVTARAKINKYSSNRIMVSGSMSLKPYMTPGKMVQVTNLDGEQYMAMIVSCTMTIDRTEKNEFTALTHVVLERIDRETP